MILLFNIPVCLILFIYPAFIYWIDFQFILLVNLPNYLLIYVV